MNPMPTGVSVEKDWERFYDSRTSDRAKVEFLLMLKERRDRYQDSDAGKMFSKLSVRWMTERFLP